MNLTCAPPLTGPVSGDGACVRRVALTDHIMPDSVVALEVVVAMINWKV